MEDKYEKLTACTVADDFTCTPDDVLDCFAFAGTLFWGMHEYEHMWQTVMQRVLLSIANGCAHPDALARAFFEATLKYGPNRRRTEKEEKE